MQYNSIAALPHHCAVLKQQASRASAQKREAIPFEYSGVPVICPLGLVLCEPVEHTACIELFNAHPPLLCLGLRPSGLGPLGLEPYGPGPSGLGPLVLGPLVLGPSTMGRGPWAWPGPGPGPWPWCSMSPKYSLRQEGIQSVHVVFPQ